jgi:hypothetical protein
MRAVIRFGAVIGVIAALSVVSLAQNPGRNSFLVVSAKSTEQLIQQVKTNPNIRDSYLRHFQMSESQLYTYLRTLRPTRLTSEQVFSVYSVPPGGELKAHTQRLKKGELVFVDMNGKPILRARCGNPLVGGPPGIVPEEELSGPNTELRLVEVPASETVPNVPLALAPAPPIVPEELVVVPTAPMPITPVASQSIPLWPLLALPVVGKSSHDGNPVPEPATMIALAAGAGVLMARRRRKN